MQRGSGVRLDPHSSVKGNTIGCSGVPRNFVRGGGSKNSVEDTGYRNGDLGEVAH